MALATGAAEKGVSQVYEGAFRPAEKRHQPWVDRCARQVQGAFAELERECISHRNSHWLLGDRITQADITLACVTTFLTDAAGMDAMPYPAVQELVVRCEALPEFASTKMAFYTQAQS